MFTHTCNLYKIFTWGAKGSSLEMRIYLHSRWEGIWINTCYLCFVLIILYSKVETVILYKIVTQGANGTSLKMQTDLHSKYGECEDNSINTCYLWLVVIILYLKVENGILYKIFNWYTNGCSLKVQTDVHTRCKRIFTRVANRSLLKVRRCEGIWINNYYLWLVLIILYLKVESGILYKIFTLGANGTSLEVQTDINLRCLRTFTRGANGSFLEVWRCEGIWINTCYLGLVLIILYSKVETGILYKIFTWVTNGTSLEVQTDIHSRCH